MLLLVYMRKLTLWLLMMMIVFCTFLTFYSAYFNKVTDCGCFGDAIPLTPWEYFGKDVVLLFLFLFFLIERNYIKLFFFRILTGFLVFPYLFFVLAFHFQFFNLFQ